MNDQALAPASGSLPLTLAGRIDRACDQYEADWKAGHFGKVTGDEIEFIPLP